MSNLDVAPRERTCTATPSAGVEVLQAREVPLGGPRAMKVRRTLPQRQRSLVGAWCFADHYGPQSVRSAVGMDVPPHPHTGLQTVSWLFEGEIEHRDSGGAHAMVRPGELNLMTAGAGICHSEVSTLNPTAAWNPTAAKTTTLHGVQLWVALPADARDTARDFVHFAPPPTAIDGGTLRVFLGEAAGARSPVATFTPLLGAQVDLDVGAGVELPVDPRFEHGVLLDTGAVTVAGAHLDRGDLAYQGTGEDHLHLCNTGNQPARMMLLGGEPLLEDLLMWWNFVGRSHDDIVEYRELWESGDSRFGSVEGYVGATPRLPAPPLPTTTLRPRPAPGRKDSHDDG